MLLEKGLWALWDKDRRPPHPQHSSMLGRLRWKASVRSVNAIPLDTVPLSVYLIYLSLFILTYQYLLIYLFTAEPMYACVYIYIYMYICIYTHTHTHKGFGYSTPFELRGFRILSHGLGVQGVVVTELPSKPRCCEHLPNYQALYLEREHKTQTVNLGLCAPNYSDLPISLKSQGRCLRL